MRFAHMKRIRSSAAFDCEGCESLERIDNAWKLLPQSLIDLQLRRMLGVSSCAAAIQRGVPVNLFDATRIVACRSRQGLAL